MSGTTGSHLQIPCTRASCFVAFGILEDDVVVELRSIVGRCVTILSLRPLLSLVLKAMIVTPPSGDSVGNVASDTPVAVACPCRVRASNAADLITADRCLLISRRVNQAPLPRLLSESRARFGTREMRRFPLAREGVSGIPRVSYCPPAAEIRTSCATLGDTSAASTVAEREDLVESSPTT